MGSVLASLALATSIILCAFAGCRDDRAASAGPATDVVRMQIGGEVFSLEIADSADEQRLGLMHRSSMPADHGMIFVFDEGREQQFWMKDTLIPLDILYLDAFGRVMTVKPMAPRDLTPVSSDGFAMYAVELNQGAAARAGVRAGDKLTLPPEVLDRQRPR